MRHQIVLALLGVVIAAHGAANRQDPIPSPSPGPVVAPASPVMDTVQTRLDTSAADHKQATADAATVGQIQAQLATAQATAAASAAQAATDDAAVGAGLTALGRPVVQKQADGSFLILTPTPTGYQAVPALDATTAIPAVPPVISPTPTPTPTPTPVSGL